MEHVLRNAIANARAASGYYSGDRERFMQAVESAALYHDLGKLDHSNQRALSRESHTRLPLPHTDAGVAALRQLHFPESAVLAAAHHAGLFSKQEEMQKENRHSGRLLRDVREKVIGKRCATVAEHVDANLDEYLRAHKAVGLNLLAPGPEGQLHSCGFTRRVALSCLVDADHGDTARHYGKEMPTPGTPPRWEERLAALDAYVEELPKGGSRDALRAEVYSACREAETKTSVRACDAPVGSGKTTSIMANLLQAAATRKLRHIIVVLPYTNIIKQSVKVYREALTLPGESPEDVVAEHHHQADFASVDLRQLATLWKAPVIVTTAVQFFETLGSYRPAQLRKLHELPGSAVFVDEMHTALPSPLWPQVWRWLQTWTAEWGGYLVLASGSLARFWELREFVQETANVPDLLPDTLRDRLVAAEGQRIRLIQKKRIMDPDELLEFLLDQPGPRLLIVNTVQSAAYLAAQLREKGKDVLHLSTALAPAHRECIIERVRERLNYSTRYSDWTLVATSCVEAGMDFSFRTGFRERASTANLIQVGGRVSRGAEHPEAVVWDFRVEGGLLTQNPSLDLSRQVVGRMFESGRIESLSPSELAKQAMRGELTAKGKSNAEALMEAERGMEYPTVGDLCRVIQADTRLVVISERLAERIRDHESVSSRELLRFSVQLWTRKVSSRDLPVLLLRGKEDEADALYLWDGAYDPDFLGYMAGALPIVHGLKQGVFME